MFDKGFDAELIKKNVFRAAYNTERDGGGEFLGRVYVWPYLVGFIVVFFLWYFFLTRFLTHFQVRKWSSERARAPWAPWGEVRERPCGLCFFCILVIVPELKQMQGWETAKLPLLPWSILLLLLPVCLSPSHFLGQSEGQSIAALQLNSAFKLWSIAHMLSGSWLKLKRKRRERGTAIGWLPFTSCFLLLMIDPAGIN